MKNFLYHLVIISFLVFPSSALAAELCDLKPLMTRYETMKSLCESKFAADFDTVEQRSRLQGYKRVLMDCQERIKATVQLVQLYNIFAAEEGLEAPAGFVSERIALQLPEFTDKTRRDVADVDQELSGVKHAVLLNFGRSTSRELSGYVSDIREVARQMGR